MIRSSRTIVADAATLDLAEQFAGPFAQALAVFLAELRRQGVEVSHGRKVPALQGAGRRERDETGTKFEPVTVEVLGTRPAKASEMEAADSEELSEDAMAELLARRIVSAIRASGVSQKQIARRLDVDPSSVSRILRQPQHSRLSTLVRLAKAAGVQVAA